MAQLDVIKKFMSTLNVHTFNSSTNDGTNYSPSKAMLDEAIKASTHYNGIDDAISSFLSDMQNSTSLDEAFGKCGIDTTNSDTGAITGYDVNPKNPVKTQDTIVLEIGNLYRAAMYSDRQIINTGDNGWLVEATSFNDTINSGGEDSINAGAGNDVINLSGRTAKIVTGGNSDTVSVAADGDVKTFSILDYVSGQTVVLGASNYDSVLNGDVATFTLKGFSSVKSSASYNSASAVVESQNLSGAKTPSVDTIGTAAEKSVAYEKPKDDDIPTYDAQTDIVQFDAETAGTAPYTVDLSTVNTLSGYFSSGSSNFLTYDPGSNCIGTVSSHFDSSYLDRDENGNLSFVSHGLKVNIKGERDPDTEAMINPITAYNIDSLNNPNSPYYSQYVMIANLYKWWIKESLELNEESLGFGFTDENVSVNEIDQYFEYDDTSGWLAYVSRWSSSDGEATHLDLVINTYYFSGISDESDPNGDGYVQIGNYYYGGRLDRTVAHELNHAVFGANVNYFGQLPMFIKEGMAELIHGVDDDRYAPMEDLLNKTINNSTVNLMADYVNLSLNHSGQVRSTESSHPYGAGYMFLRWLAKTAADEAGDDYIENADPNLLFDTGKGNDTIINSGDNVTINSGTGDDKIINSGASVSINSGTGDDKITNNSANVLIDAGTDNDDITNYAGRNSTILCGTGDDMVYNEAYTVTIDGGDDADYITSFGQNVSINGNDGNDYIITRGREDIVDGWPGYVKPDNNTLVGGYGNDTIGNTGDNTSIDGGDGNDSISNSGDNVTIRGGAGSDTIHGGSNSTTDGGENNDVLYGNNNSSVNGGANNDQLSTEMNEIYGSTGNSVCSASNVTLSGGGGSDTIFNGTDDYENSTFEIIGGTNLLLEGGAGNDSISNKWSSNVTLVGDAGNDTISNRGDNVLFKYTDGDGFDRIEGFNTTSTLQIGDGTDSYSKATVDKDIVVTVGDGEITLVGAASLSTLNIKGKEIIPPNPLLIVGTDEANKIGNSLNGATILAFGGADSVNNIGANVSIVGGDGDDSIINYPNGTNSTILGGAGSDTIHNMARTVTIDGGDDNDSITTDVKDVTITTGAGFDTIKIGTEVTSFTVTDFGADDVIELSSAIASLAVQNNSLVAGSVTIGGITQIVSTTDNWLGTSDTVYYSPFTSAGAVLSDDGQKITYNPNSTQTTLFTLTGVTSTKGITVNGNTVTVGEQALGTTDVSITDGYTLKLGDDVKQPETTEATFTHDGNLTATYSANITEGYSLVDNKIIYTPASNKTLFTLTGVTSTKGITVGGNTVYIPAGIVSSEVTISNDEYTIEIVGNEYDVILTDDDPDTFVASAFTANIDASERKKAIDITGNMLDNTITGGAGNDTLTGGDGYDTFVMSAGNDTVTDYSDEGDLIQTSDTVNAKISGNNVVFTDENKNSLTVKNGAAGQKIKVVNADGETVSANTYYNDRIVGNESVTLGANFRGTYKIHSDNDNVTEVDGSAVLRSLNLIGSENDETLIGGMSSDTLDGGEGDDVLTGGGFIDIDTFIFGGGNDIITDYGISDRISLGNDIDSFATDEYGNLTLYTENGSLTIQNGVGMNISFLTGNKTTSSLFSAEGLFNKKYTAVTLNSSTKNFNAVNYFKLVTIDGSSTDGVEITGNAKNNLITGGDGDDVLTGGGGKNTFICSGGADTVTDYKTGKDKVSLGSDFEIQGVTLDSGVTIDFDDEDSLRIENAGRNTKVSLVTTTITKNGKSKSVTATVYFDDDRIFDKPTDVAATKVTVTSDNADFSDDTVYKKLKSITALEDLEGVEINGNKLANSIVGSGGDDILQGYDGNDTLWGGNGDDTFIYQISKKSGKDTICDYEDDELLQILDANGKETGFKKSSFNKHTLTLTLDKGSIVFKNIDADTSFNINGDTYRINGKKLEAD